ncbi:hypothetical protein L6164_003181 [Bauhinia variegata]|uniref:Uncharacterized protein n=1 Tax=Bauhinia variegata TaxID=167791 RepID=A0ACB9Q0G2_BAUVA|nr:hypothetical protein L6164_003181 [Bauhinia variegata]
MTKRKAADDIQEQLAEEDHIPEELIEETLLTLPIKSLNRFRCVSKQFDAIISSHRFGHKHYETAEGNTIDLSQRKIFVMNSMSELNTGAFSEESGFSLDKFQLINPDFALASSGTKTCISSRGIICFSINHVLGGPDIYLWNPLNPNNTQRIRYCLKEDCIYYPMGFGYDSSTDDHKIVLPLEPRNEEPGDLIRFQVFSIKNPYRKEIKAKTKCGPFSFPYLRSGVYIMGGIHWLGFCGKKRMIVRLRVGDNRLFLMQPPPHDRKQAKTMEMGVVGDCLSVCIGEEGKGVTIWCLTNSLKTWIKFAFIPCSIIQDSICCMIPIFALETGEALMLCPVNNELSIYNLKLNKRTSVLPASQVPIAVTVHVEGLLSYL